MQQENNSCQVRDYKLTCCGQAPLQGLGRELVLQLTLSPVKS